MTHAIKTNYERLRAIRWVARITSLISILVLLMFLLGEGFDIGKITSGQWVGFLFFPVGLVLGFIIGWKNEIMGGSISLFSLLGFYLIYGMLLNGNFLSGIAFLIFTIPAFIFLGAGLFAKSAFGSKG